MGSMRSRRKPLGSPLKPILGRSKEMVAKSPKPDSEKSGIGKARLLIIARDREKDGLHA